MSKYLTFGYATDVGLIRRANYDAYGCFIACVFAQGEHNDFGLFAVASGGGWGGEGGKASAIAIRVIMREVITKLDIPMLNSEESTSNLDPLLRAAVEKANVEILNGLTFDEEAQSIMDGATLTAVAIVGNTLHLVHIGDTRGYLVVDGGIEQITRDHTLGQRLVELGQITREQAKGYPHTQVWYSFLGTKFKFECEVFSRTLTSGSKIVLCTDGLWQKVDDDEILAVVTKHLDVQGACEALIRLANARGGEDNVTVVVVELPAANGLH